MSSPRIAPVQWLRALAATLVLLVHAADLIAGGPVATTGRLAPSVPNLAVFGASGVDLFFVISGFVMAQSLSRAGRDPWRFLARRWLRIVPLFACVSLVYMAIMHDPLTPQGAAMSFTVLPLLDGAGYHGPALYPGWSLGFEFAFYAIVAVAMRAARHRVAVLLALTTAVALAGLFVHPVWAPLRLLFNPLLLEFALGIVVWIAWRRGTSARVAAPALVTGIALLAIGIAVGLGPALSVDIEAAVAGTSGLARTWTWGVPWALVVTGVIDAVPGGRFARVARIVARIGDASYSTYLVHPCLIALLWIAGGSLPRGDPLVVDPVVVAMLFVVLSTLAGLACHRWIERPLLATLARPGAHRAKPDLKPAGCMVAP